MGGDGSLSHSDACVCVDELDRREVTYIYCLQKFMRASIYFVLSLLFFFFPRLPYHFYHP